MKLGLKQSELGYLLGYAENSTVSRIEAGKQKPTGEERLLLELIFGLSTSRLFPEIHQELVGKLLDRLGQFEQSLCETPATRESMAKLSKLRSLRKELASACKNRS